MFSFDYFYLFFKFPFNYFYLFKNFFSFNNFYLISFFHSPFFNFNCFFLLFILIYFVIFILFGYTFFLFYENFTNSDLILNKKVSSPCRPINAIDQNSQRVTKRSTCAFSHFSQSPVPLFYVQHVEKETNVGQLQGEGSQKKTKRQRGSCCYRSERWNYRTEVV